jgi:DNA-binding transcriptional regulator GbsR (MarR family)
MCKVDEVTVEIAQFVERFGATLEEGGVPRMPARVFAALLVTDSGRLTAAELAEQLRISPAAVSGAVRYLTQVGLVAREREAGSRRDVYALHHEVWYEAIVNREPLLSRWRRSLEEGVEAVGADTPAGRRLAESADFFSFLIAEMPAMLARWRDRSH